MRERGPTREEIRRELERVLAPDWSPADPSLLPPLRRGKTRELRAGGTRNPIGASLAYFLSQAPSDATALETRVRLNSAVLNLVEDFAKELPFTVEQRMLVKQALLGRSFARLAGLGAAVAHPSLEPKLQTVAEAIRRESMRARDRAAAAAEAPCRAFDRLGELIEGLYVTLHNALWNRRRDAEERERQGAAESVWNSARRRRWSRKAREVRALKDSLSPEAWEALKAQRMRFADDAWVDPEYVTPGDYSLEALALANPREGRPPRPLDGRLFLMRYLVATLGLSARGAAEAARLLLGAFLGDDVNADALRAWFGYVEWPDSQRRPTPAELPPQEEEPDPSG